MTLNVRSPGTLEAKEHSWTSVIRDDAGRLSVAVYIAPVVMLTGSKMAGDSRSRQTGRCRWSSFRCYLRGPARGRRSRGNADCRQRHGPRCDGGQKEYTRVFWPIRCRAWSSRPASRTHNRSWHRCSNRSESRHCPAQADAAGDGIDVCVEHVEIGAIIPGRPLDLFGPDILCQGRGICRGE